MEKYKNKSKEELVEIIETYKNILSQVGDHTRGEVTIEKHNNEKYIGIEYDGNVYKCRFDGYMAFNGGLEAELIVDSMRNSIEIKQNKNEHFKSDIDKYHLLSFSNHSDEDNFVKILDSLEQDNKTMESKLPKINKENKNMKKENNLNTTEYKVEGIEEVYEKEDDDNSTLSFYKEGAESANRLLHKYKDCEDSFEITMEDITTIDEIQIEIYGSEKYEGLAETQGVNSNIIDMDKFRKLLEDIRDNLSMEYCLYKVNNK